VLYLALRICSAIVQARRDCVLELITLGYHQSATFTCIGDASTSWPQCEKWSATDARWWSFARCRLARFYRLENRNTGSRQAIDLAINSSTSIRERPRRDEAVRLFCGTSLRAMEPNQSVSAHLPRSKGPAAADAFPILHPDRPSEICLPPLVDRRPKTGRLCSESVRGRRIPSARDPLKKLRRICLALPPATEKIAWGEPTFRVGGKMFSTCNGESHPGPLELWIKALPEAQEVLVASDPKRYSVAPYRPFIGMNRCAGQGVHRRGSRARVLREDRSEAARYTAGSEFTANFSRSASYGRESERHRPNPAHRERPKALHSHLRTTGRRFRSKPLSGLDAHLTNAGATVLSRAT